MKKHTNPFKFITILAFLAVPLLSIASGGDNVDKKKNISKSYTVSGDEKLSIENSFGEVAVSTWDRNEIRVDVEIGVSASTEEKAQQMMNEISVSDKKGGNEISFKTEIGEMGNDKKNKDGDQRKFYVDYKIIMPSGNPLSIENNFGKINIGNFIGPVSLTSKFGELTTGRLSNARTLHVEFGKAEIGPVTDPDITLKFNSKSYIKNISGNAKIHIEFCGNVDFTIDNTIKDLSLFESYSNVRLNVPENLSASFSVHTNFGTFDNSSGIHLTEEKEDDNMGPKFDKDFTGSSGNGGAQIKIKSSFGKIHLANVGDRSVDKDSGDNDNDNDSGNKNKDDKGQDSDNSKL
jgi:hypothetical protein